MENKVDKLIVKLKRQLKKETNKEYKLELCAILSSILYAYNQYYADEDIENVLLDVKDTILSPASYLINKDTVLFYDGFGLDLRGWAASYVKALSSLGYFVVYACPSSSEGKIPHIISELHEDSSKIIYLDVSSSNIDKAKKIDTIFKEHKPCAAFFYTTPSDISAAIAFSNNPSSTRIQVDLTDHAFWIGVNALDYITECREMGASLAVYERGIAKEKIIKLDCAPYINRDKYLEPLPFNIYKENYIFTGGALYKTLGDTNLLYYKTISYILDIFPDMKFLYAGSGNDSEMKKLISKYKGRVYLINERPDYFELIKYCKLYINSYPMFGGLMMRYAALAHKVPITLRHDNDADGILFNQSELGIEFDDYKDYISEIQRLLSDDDYRASKENLVGNSVLSESRFADNLKLLIEEHRTEFHFDEIKRFDTIEFRKEYKRRYSNKMLYKTIAQKSNLKIVKYFPVEFTLGIIIKIKEKIAK